jgi:hypothetical protein
VGRSLYALRFLNEYQPAVNMVFTTTPIADSLGSLPLSKPRPSEMADGATVCSDRKLGICLPG